MTAAPALGNEFYGPGFTADFNADGFEDVIWFGGGGVQGGPGGRIIVGLNNGVGAFSISTYSNPDGNYYYVGSLAEGDFNGDGYADFAGRGEGYVDVWLFQPGAARPFARSTRVSVPPGENNNTVAVADFTSDGILDLAVISGRNGGDQNFSLLNVYPGHGDGMFGAVTSQPILNVNSDGQFPKWAEAGDLNGDGKADLVTSVVYGRVAVFLGRGDGSFTPGAEYGTGIVWGSGQHLTLHDLNRDGRLDLVYADDNQNRSVLNVRYGLGDGTFSTSEAYALPGGFVSSAFADFNRDGATDLVVGLTGYSNILFGAGPGFSDVAAGDVNGDGRDDLVGVDADRGHLIVSLATADGSLARQTTLLVGLGASAVAVADLNGDGRTDLVTANTVANGVTLRTQGAGGTFTRRDLAAGAALNRLSVGDVTGDGRPDVVASSRDAKALYVFRNGASGLGAPTVIALGDAPADVIVGDATGDGVNDLIVTLPDSKRLQIVPGTKAGPFGTPISIALPFAAGRLGLADFNADGKPDLAVTVPSLDLIAVLLGRGGNRFARPQSVAVGASPSALRVADVNGDGRPDLVVTNTGDDTVSTILNRYDPAHVYHATATASDPDGDPLTFDLDNAPGGMLLDETTGAIVWAPSADQIGTNAVTITVSDGRGGMATLGFSVDVALATPNAAPVLTSVPDVTLSGGDAFHYAASALDRDGDALRYRLIDAPAGATIDATTGAVLWDPRSGGMNLNGPATDAGYVLVPMTAALQGPSLTVEGFFKLDRTDVNQIFVRKMSWNPYPFGTDSFILHYQWGRLRAGIAGANGTSEAAIPWQPEAGRWYHLALTFDDATGVLRLVLDGFEVARAETGRHLFYDGLGIQIGYQSDPFYGDTDNVRIWDRARTDAELRADATRLLAANEPGLLLDYRFDDGDAQTVFDHSGFGHHGRRLSDRSAWPRATAGVAPSGVHDFVVRVEDGRGGFDEQAFRVTVVSPVPGRVAGTLFEDANGNGNRDATDPPLGEWVVYVDRDGNGDRGPGEPTATTSAEGSYVLADLFEGDFRLAVESKAGFVPFPGRTVAVRSGETTVADVAAVARPAGQIRGTVRVDLNGDGDADDVLTVRMAAFDAASPDFTGWSHTSVATSPSGAKFLGEFANDTVTLTVGGNASPLPTHDILSVSFDLLILNSMDGNQSGPDVFTFAIDGVPTLVTSFANTGADQAYPGSYPGASNPSRTGAVANNSLGYTFYGDSTYRITLTVPHARTGATISWSARNLGGGGDESWGLNGVTVAVREPGRAGADVYLDTNGNGAFEPGEPRTTTDTAGVYAFDTLPAGTYSVRLDQPEGWQTIAPSSGSRSVALAAGATSTGLDFTVRGSADAVSRPQIASVPRTDLTARSTFRYAATATDPASRPLTYELISGPAGMVLNPDTGVIVWTPRVADVGAHSVSLLVRNDRGGFSIQAFTLSVAAPNTNPVFASPPSTHALVGVPFAVNVIAQDAEQTTLAYELATAPSGATVDATGRVAWTPLAADLGSRTFAVVARDSVGGTARMEFVVTVTNDVAAAPQWSGNPRTAAAANVPYFATLGATDPNGLSLTYSLVSGPVGMTVSPTGFVTWTPPSVGTEAATFARRTRRD